VMSASPGRIIGEEVITFARPRSVIGLKGDLQFGATVARLWNALGGEVMKASGQVVEWSNGQIVK